MSEKGQALLEILRDGTKHVEKIFVYKCRYCEQKYQTSSSDPGAVRPESYGGICNSWRWIEHKPGCPMKTILDLLDEDGKEAKDSQC